MRINFTFFLFTALFFALLLSIGCGKETCVPNGFVAKNDTTITCSCGEFSLHSLDTFIVNNKGNCSVQAFKERKLTDWLDDHEVIRIGMEPDAPPTFFTRGDKETGFDYELLKAIFPKVFEGIRMEVKGYKYDTLPQLLLQPNPQIEIIAGGYVADTSLPNILWTKPYLTYGYALITRESDNQTIKDLASLKGKTVGVYDDGITEFWLKKNCPEVGQIIKAVDDTEKPLSDWMQILIDKKVDAIIYDYPFAVQEIEDYDDVLMISNKRLNQPNDLMGYSFGIPSGNKKLLKKMNDAIDEIKKTPQFMQMVAAFIPDPDKGKAIAIEEILSAPTTAINVKPTQTIDNKIALVNNSNANITKKEEKVVEISPANKKEEAPKNGHYDGKIYTVEQGETLSVIAKKILGDADRWEELYILNPHIVSPDIVYVGTILKVPKYEMVNKDQKKWGDKEQDKSQQNP